MKQSVASSGTELREAPVESPGNIGTVARYHAPLRAAFDRIKTDNNGRLSDRECLRMTFYTVNASTGPEGSCPMLLVYGILPLPPSTIPFPTQIMHIKAIEDSILEFQMQPSKSIVAFDLPHRNGQKDSKHRKDCETCQLARRS